MALMVKNIIQEVVLSTSDNVWINGNCFEFELPNYISCEKNAKIGVKNIRFPNKTFSVNAKVHISHFLDIAKFDFSKVDKMELKYTSWPDLCQQLEVMAYNSLVYENPGSGQLDFRNSKMGDGEESFILSLRYEHNRIVIKKNINYVLYLNVELESLLEFPLATPITGHDGEKFWKLEKYMDISKNLVLCNDGETIVHLAIYDIIESSTYIKNGSRFPVLCSFYGDNRNLATNSLLSCKNASVSYLKRIRCYFYDRFFECYKFDNCNLKNDPFQMTLVFFEF